MGGGKGRRGEGEEEERVEEGVGEGVDIDYLGLYEFFSNFAKDPNVELVVKQYTALVPLDSHKIDFGRVPSRMVDYIIARKDLQILIQELVERNEEMLKFLESYRLYTDIRILSAEEGWKARLFLSSGIGGVTRR